MSTDDLIKKPSLRLCSSCGQYFGLAFNFCPGDGTRLASGGDDSSPVAAVLPIAPESKEEASLPLPSGAGNPIQGADPRPWVALQEVFQISAAKMAQAKESRQVETEKSKSQSKTTLPDIPTLGHDQSSLRQQNEAPRLYGDHRRAKDITAGRHEATGPLDFTRDPLDSMPIDINCEAFVGRVLDGQYEIVSVIARGGMSIVYKAHHTVLNKVVAVKALLPHLLGHQQSLDRFRQEARAVSNLSHPNIVSVHDFSISEGQPYIVMDYINGTPLSSLIAGKKRMPTEFACEVFLQIADALAHAHAGGVVHRDLKPSNVLLVGKAETSPPRVAIVDFGIAKLLPLDGEEGINLTRTGELFGSPPYMSPEQCKGEPLDGRSDLYSLGCLMYEVLAGEPPFDATNTMELLYKHVNDVPRSFSSIGLKVPSKLEAIIFKCLAKSPSQRYQSMVELHHDLEQINSTNVFAKLISRWELFLLRRPPASRRDRLLVLVNTMLIISCLVVAGYLISLDMRVKESSAAKAGATWIADEPIKSIAPSSSDELIYSELVNGTSRYPIYKANHDTTKVRELIGKLETFGQRMLDKHCFDLAIPVLNNCYNICKDFDSETAARTLIVEAKLADAMRERGDEGAASVYLHLVRHIQHAELQSERDRFIIGRKIADCFYRLREYGRAANFYNNALKTIASSDALAVGSSVHDPELMADVALCQSHLAECEYQVAQHLNKTGERRELLRLSAGNFTKAANFWEQSKGKHSHDFLVTQRKLAKCFGELKDFPQAKQAYGTLFAYADGSLLSSRDLKGMLLREYSDTLWQTGDIFNSLRKRLDAWMVLAGLST